MARVYSSTSIQRQGICGGAEYPLCGAVRPHETAALAAMERKSVVLWARDYAELPDPNTIDTQTRQRYLSAIPREPVLAAAMTSLVTEKPTRVRESAP